MFVDNFNLDGENAKVIQNDVRLDSDNNRVIRQKWNNGFTWIYTELRTGGFKDMDFSHELYKTSSGTYRVDIQSPKKDFHDYY